MSGLMVGVAFGEMLFPLIIGYMTTESNPSAFPIIIFSLLIMSSITGGLFFYFGNRTEKSILKANDAGIDTSKSAKPEKS